MRQPLPGGLVLLAASLLLSGCVVNVDTQAQILRDEKRFPVTGVPDVQLTTFDGAIEVRSWERAEVLVEVEKRGPTLEAVESLEIRMEQSGDRIEVEVRRPRSEVRRAFGFQHSPAAKLTVSVPQQANIVARTGDGSIRAERITGRLELRTGDGSIRGSRLEGDVTVQSGDGSITLDDVAGALNGQTGDGSITVSGELRTVRLRTGDGSIVYRGRDGSAMADDWELSTGDGSITLYLPESFGAQLDAQTGDGRIVCDLPIAESGSREARRSLRGRLGDGGPQLRVRTNDGSIRIRRS